MSKFVNMLKGINKEINEAFSISSPVKKLSKITFAEVIQAIYAKFGAGVFSEKDLISNFQYQKEETSSIVVKLTGEGYLERPARGVFKLAQQGIDFASHSTVSDLKKAEDEVLGSDDLEGLGGEEEAKAAENTGEVARGVKDIEKLRVKKFKTPVIGNNSKFKDQIKTLLSHMKSTGQGLTKTTFLIAGDTGLGKTSMINNLSVLTGIPTVIIEAPHITQEHLINIPFLVIDGNKKRDGQVTIDTNESDFKVVQAESSLVTQIKTMTQRSPEQRQALINKNPVLKQVSQDTQIARRINGIEGMFNCILFIDEYFRTSSKQIKNVLRNILNGRIGNDHIPEGVYIIMASNVDDQGIDDIPENYDFHMMKYDAPEKEDYMNYIKGKYVAETEEVDANGKPIETETPSGISLKSEVYNTFYDKLTDNLISVTDESTDTRLSPRRLEQLILYVNSVVPCKTNDEVAALYAIVKSNFSNYLSGDMNSSYEAYLDIVKTIVKETSPDVNANTLPLGKADWKKSLAQEIDVKMSLGEHRKYIPVIAGDPGIGKTQIARTIAKEKHMGLIMIDVSNLNAEDFTGLPIANTSGEEITTKFSEPNLYTFIMKEYNAIINDYKEDNRKYNVLILFDEISRTKPAVFNAMRKVLLEKEFSTEFKIPEDCMIIGALNPVGEGTTELTRHTTDSLDIIAGTAKFSDVMAYIEGREEFSKINQALGFEANKIVANIITSVAREFQSVERPDTGEKLSQEEAPFWWTVDDETFYISGREYTEAISNIVGQLEDRLLDMDWDPNANYEDTDYEAFMQEALNVTAKTFGDTLNMIVTKMKVSNFVPTLIGKLTNNSKYKDAFKVMKEKKAADELPLDELYKKAGRNLQFISKRMVGSYLRYTTSPTQFGQDYSRMLNLLFEDHSVKDVASVIMELASNMKTIFDELDYPEAVQNAYTDIMLKMTKGQMIALIENPDFGIDILDDRLIDAILSVFG